MFLYEAIQVLENDIIQIHKNTDLMVMCDIVDEQQVVPHCQITFKGTAKKRRTAYTIYVLQIHSICGSLIDHW